MRKPTATGVDRPAKKRPTPKRQVDDPRDDLRDKIAKQRGRLRGFMMRQSLRDASGTSRAN